MEELNLISKKNGAIIIYGKEKCANQCLFCYGGRNYQTDEEKFIDAISHANFFIQEGIKTIEISGGDPGEYEYIPEIVLYLKSNGIEQIQLSTHGRTLKDENLVKRLAIAGLTHCKIPLYGSTPEIHNKCTQINSDSVGNAFEDSIEGIKNCANSNIHVVGQIAMNQYNKEDINNIIQLYLDLTEKNVFAMMVGITCIARLDYKYTGEWYLPIKEIGQYINAVVENHPKFLEKTNFKILDIPYCVIGRHSNKMENKSELPNLGNSVVTESMRSSISDKIPHYRIKSYFDECNSCCLKSKCSGVPVNEIKMFGVDGLKAIKE